MSGSKDGRSSKPSKRKRRKKHEKCINEEEEDEDDGEYMIASSGNRRDDSDDADNPLLSQTTRAVIKDVNDKAGRKLTRKQREDRMRSYCHNAVPALKMPVQSFSRQPSGNLP